jgi:uncharacterized membrane protein YkvA (DUF1232 family)
MARYACRMKMLWKPWFRRQKKKAERLVENPAAVLRAAENAANRAQTARGPLARIWNDLQTALRLARAWSRRDYRGVTRGSIVLVIAGLLYLLSPIDAIVDAIPVVGFLDDALVLGWVFRQVRWELDAFREWEARQLLGTSEPPGSSGALPAPAA